MCCSPVRKEDEEEFVYVIDKKALLNPCGDELKKKREVVPCNTKCKRRNTLVQNPHTKNHSWLDLVTHLESISDAAPDFRMALHYTVSERETKSESIRAESCQSSISRRDNYCTNFFIIH